MIRYLIPIAMVLPIEGSIIWRADTPDVAYVKLGVKSPAVVAIGRLGDATLVRRQWLVTAAHVARAVANGRGGDSVRIGSRNYAIDRIALHPDWRIRGRTISPCCTFRRL